MSLLKVGILALITGKYLACRHLGRSEVYEFSGANVMRGIGVRFLYLLGIMRGKAA